MYTSNLLQVGKYTLPLTCGTLFGGVIVGATRWCKPTNIYLSGAAMIMTIFAGLLSTINPDKIKPALAYSAFYGAGVGVLEISVILLVQFSTGPEHIGIVTGILSSARAAASACGCQSSSSFFSAISET
jgi:hypothetical protein